MWYSATLVVSTIRPSVSYLLLYKLPRILKNGAMTVAGKIPIDELAQKIWASVGPSGRNKVYGDPLERTNDTYGYTGLRIPFSESRQTARP